MRWRFRANSCSWFPGATVLFCVGLADDLAGVGYRIKFLAQLLSAALLLCSGVWIDNLDGLFGLHHVPTAVARC
ncbi:MAG: hypothetical protein ACLR8Y_08500 [Alistipes indistinctus]